MDFKTQSLILSDSVKRLIVSLGGRPAETNSTVDIEYCLTEAENLHEDNKLVCAVMNSTTFENNKYRKQRKTLIEKGLVESVVLLPSRLLDGTGISISILILSKGNTSLMAVDASEQFTSESKSKSILTDKNIEAIVAACVNESSFSIRMTYSEITENDFSLTPGYYVKINAYMQGAVEFDTLIKRHACGLQLRPDDIQRLHSNHPTDYQYVEPKNIFNGEIDINLPYLAECRDAYKNHQIRNHNIVITKLGNPIKVAVAEIPDNKMVIAVGRLYVFDVDEGKADPYYIKKYLSSEEGKTLLLSCSEGLAMTNLNIKKILKLPIKMKE